MSVDTRAPSEWRRTWRRRTWGPAAAAVAAQVDERPRPFAEATP